MNEQSGTVSGTAQTAWNSPGSTSKAWQWPIDGPSRQRTRMIDWRVHKVDVGGGATILSHTRSENNPPEIHITVHTLQWQIFRT